MIVPPRATAVPSETAANAPTQRDRHLQCIAGTAAWAGSADEAQSLRRVIRLAGA